MNSAQKLGREVSGVVSQLRKQLGDNLVSIVQIGSSLRPTEMVEESDLDFVVVVRRKPKRFVTVDSHYETTILDYSSREFKRLFAKGEPIPLMAVRFGRPWFGKGFLRALGEPKPTPYTTERWYLNGLSVYGMAIMEYFSGGCACCYLKDCHHSARNLLWAKIVRDKGLLCETRTDVLRNIGDVHLRRAFQKLIGYRKRPSGVSLDVHSAERGLHGRAAQPLLLAEQIACSIVHEVEGRDIYRLADVVARAKQQRSADRIHSVWLSTREEGVAEYLVTLFDKKHKISHVHVPFYIRGARKSV